jgi:hypothetical protein
MVQLRLFDTLDDIQYAMSLTSAELPKIKQANYGAYCFIKDIRSIVHKQKHMYKRADMEYKQDMDRIYR